MRQSGLVLENLKFTCDKYLKDIDIQDVLKNKLCKEIKEQILFLQDKLDKLNNDFSFLYSLRLDKRIAENEFMEKSKAINGERQAIKHELDLLNEKINVGNIDGKAEDVTNNIERFLHEDITTEIICDLIKRIEVSKNKISIIYKFQEY